MEQKIIKSLFEVVSFVAICLIFSSCEKDVITISPDYPNVDVFPSSLYFDSDNMTKSATVHYNGNWDVRYDVEWVHVSRDGAGFTVSVDDNRTKETRKCIITVYDPNDSYKKKDVTISQSTSLVTLICSESELNFASYEGASNTLSIQSKGEWNVRSVPEWLRASVSSGNGNKSISFTTLSANKTSIDRTGKVVIGTNDEEVQISVKQYGGVMSNCQVTPKNITVLSNGIAFDMDYSRASNVAHYYRGYMEASRAGIMTNPEIISTLQREFQRHLPSDDEVADFSDLKPNTKYIIFTLAYDMEGKRGDLLSTEVKTCKEEVNEPCGWISDLECTGYYWEWNVTKSATCYSYWMMTTENKDIALASDVLQAWWLEDAIRRNSVTEYYNGGDWRQVRGGNMIAVWTRGKTSNGTWAGKISLKGCEVSSSATTRAQGIESASSRAMTKQAASRDHSGSKLTPDQYQLFIIK